MTIDAPVTPLELPSGPAGGRLVLFGGTFDPPHRAHVELPLAARELIESSHARSPGAAGQTWLAFVPAARSPHKQHGPEASDADRLAMLRLALEEAGSPPRVLIWTDEIDRAEQAHRSPAGQAEPSYMVDTIRRAATAAPGWTLSLLIGADQALSFHRWRDARRILDLAEVFVLPRAEIASPAVLTERLRGTGEWSQAELDRWKRAMLPTRTLEVAATPVRAWLREPSRHAAELQDALGASVLRYIRRHGLYGAPPPQAVASPGTA